MELDGVDVGTRWDAVAPGTAPLSYMPTHLLPDVRKGATSMLRPDLKSGVASVCGADVGSGTSKHIRNSRRVRRCGGPVLQAGCRMLETIGFLSTTLTSPSQPALGTQHAEAKYESPHVWY
eukprot:2422212-Rhodomonas_salina.3